MGFLIKLAFWFSVVLLLLPLGPSDGEGPSINPLQAFFAAKEAVGDVAGICERKPEVCEVGKAAIQTIGARAREGARIAYEMMEENGTSTGAPVSGDVDDLTRVENAAAAGPAPSGLSEAGEASR